MTEQCVEQQTSQEDVRRSNRGQDRDYHSDVENTTDGCHRCGRMVDEALQTDQDHLELPGRKKPALVRSKTLDNSLLTSVQTDADSKLDRKKSQYSQLSKGNGHYHKIFKEISKDEQLRQSYTCALQKDILYQGRMFVSDNWICFHSKVFGKDTKIAIPVTSITHIKKTKTAILLPNALVVATAHDRYVFVSFLSRDNTYKFLIAACLHLEKSPCSSPIPSSVDHSFTSQRSPLSPRFPLSDRVGGRRQRRPESEESSSSDSQNLEYDKMAEFPVPPFLDVLSHTENTSPPEQQHKAKKQHLNQQSPDVKQHSLKGAGSDVIIDSRLLKPVSLNNLLIIYIFLVCVLVLSSCYLTFRIVSLEQRLTSLGSVADFRLHENSILSRSADVNAELFSELLTVNLLKLEKVQKNLQRLLEEAA
ncbi:GRAM domain-containing protein 2B [Oryzias melastigma]|uniref:GRAM domain containing 2B n=1 Tax=Oryzias melastigma TaxID=30732 RepID=A0A3B3BBB4_ORYME|nr:GRAM domain-containing protein 2B [Oryzias melastigma]